MVAMTSPLFLLAQTVEEIEKKIKQRQQDEARLTSASSLAGLVRSLVQPHAGVGGIHAVFGVVYVRAGALPGA
jgi:hypothetical protein